MLADPDTIPCEYFNERLEKKITTSLVKNRYHQLVRKHKLNSCLDVTDNGEMLLTYSY